MLGHVSGRSVPRAKLFGSVFRFIYMEVLRERNLGLVEEEVVKTQPNMSGLEKASVLLITLGAEISSAVLQQLTPDEIERLAAEILRLKKIDPKTRRRVLDDCRKTILESPEFGGMEYAQTVLSQVFGETKAREVLGKLAAGGGVGTLRWIRSISPRQLVHAIRNERPQVVALVIGHLPPEQAAEVLSALPEDIQGQVVLRLTTMQPTDPEVIRYLNQTLHLRLASSDNAAMTEVGGNDAVVQILNAIDRSSEKKILDYLTGVDEDVANSIKEQMFVFEDLLNLDDRAIQAVLREVPQEDLRLALKGASPEDRDVFFRNMSQRAAETLKEDLEATGPVRLRDVEAAQGRIVIVARQLDEAGEISLRESNEEVVV